MEKTTKRKKIMYCILIAIIIIGIIFTYFLRLNFTLEYSKATKININIGKEYNIDDIKQIAEEVFETKQIEYQKIENFQDSIAITVKEASEEQIANLTTKIQEKYELENTDSLIKTANVGHYRGRDIIKPYIIPMAIATIILLIYVGIRYFKLGIFKVVLTLALRLVISQAVYLSLIAITRIPIGVYTMPISIGLYIIVTVLTASEFQKRLEKIMIEEK